MKTISLHTANCIVTGKPAAIWCGHVTAKGYGPIREDCRMPLLQVGVIAGFADREAEAAARSDERGCFGEWQESYGLLIDLTAPHRIVEQVAAGDFLSIELSLFNKLIKA